MEEVVSACVSAASMARIRVSSSNLSVHEKGQVSEESVCVCVLVLLTHCIAVWWNRSHRYIATPPLRSSCSSACPCPQLLCDVMQCSGEKSQEEPEGCVSFIAV